MLKVRYSEDRGRGHHGWLDSRHTFSFAQYYDPRFVGFHDLLMDVNYFCRLAPTILAGGRQVHGSCLV
jgi:redox-sensitive bicupin YhaK (pirin superfamily)